MMKEKVERERGIKKELKTKEQSKALWLKAVKAIDRVNYNCVYTNICCIPKMVSNFGAFVSKCERSVVAMAVILFTMVQQSRPFGRVHW